MTGRLVANEPRDDLVFPAAFNDADDPVSFAARSGRQCGRTWSEDGDHAGRTEEIDDGEV